MEIDEERLEEMLARAAEKGAEAALKHFGAFDEKDRLNLSMKWQKMTNLLDIYDGISLQIGRSVVWIIGVAVAILAGVITGFKAGLFGGGNG